MKETKCQFAEACQFYNDPEMLSVRIHNEFKKNYCFNCQDACAIFMVIMNAGVAYLPQELFPNEYDKALDIIKYHHK